MFTRILHRRKLKGSEGLCDLPWVTPRGITGASIQTGPACPLPPEPLCYPASPKVQQERRGELWARESQQHGGKKIPPGLIKCLINSRRRIGRNNEHLSESFIAYNTLSPAFSHVIFTTGLGGRYYHYLHFTGEERKAPTHPCSGWAGCIPLGVWGDGDVVMGTCFPSPGRCHKPFPNCHWLKG